jgi:prefoldin subunit 5
MKDQSKTKQVLIQELDSLRERIAEMERTESERKQVEETLQLQEGRR